MSTNKHFKYDNHQEEWTQALVDPERKKVSDSWLDQNTLDAWRHERMRDPLRDIIKSDTDSSWLTVGDGRYGTDSRYLISQGVQNVHSSDISDTLLKIANQQGVIREFSAQNAEDLKFDDNFFDYVYCKESFHHFPRPYIALHEMFRVAKKAVILTEPRDREIDRAKYSYVRYFFKKLLRRELSQHEFERVGNYVYTISEREMEKFLLGMHYRLIAFKGCNDFYIEGMEFIPREAVIEEHKRVIRKFKKRLKFYDILNRLGFSRSALLTTVLFKEKPSETLIDSMKRKGWLIRELPQNPYVKKS